MLTHYVTMALRALRRHPGYAFINVTGLAVGMACCLLILLFVRDELRYDRFHEHADRIYRIVSDWGDFSVPATNPPFIVRLRQDYPEITLAMLNPYSGLVQRGDLRFQEDRIFFANPEVFDVFSIPLLRGDPATVLSEPFAVVITDAVARKYFGDADPVGQTLRVDNQFDVEVTGVMAPLPAQSHLHPDILASFATLETLFDFSNSTSWGNNSYYTYLLLPEGMTSEALEAQLPGFIERHAGDDWNGAEISLQPLTDIHLRSHHNMELEPNGQRAYVYLFSIIAGFILLIACVNFMNLATARSAERAREVGMRKVVGARREQLVQQFLAESVMMALLALVLALGLATAALPAFRSLSGKAITAGALLDGALPLVFLAVSLVVGVLAGSYPAFVLSAFRPVRVLKGAFRSSTRGALLRKGLVVFQFTTSVVLIIGTMVVYRQLDFLRTANLGFDKEQVVVVPVQSAQAVMPQVAAFREALLQQANVLAVTESSEGVPSELPNGSGFTVEGSGLSVDEASDRLAWGARNVAVGHDYFETLGTEMVAGRSFSRDYPSDSSAFVVNEAALRLIMDGLPEQIRSADDLVGKQLTIGMRGITGPVVGVVRDFNLSSLHEAVEPVVFFIFPNWYDHLLVRVSPGDYAQSVATVQRTWQQFFPDWPFAFRFADQAFDAQYRAEERLGRIFTTFALLAIAVACLGLFGLASFTAQQRTKEIGVRKVLGASVAGIIVLLSGAFTRLVGVAFLIATPVAYVVMNRWLDTFAYRVDMRGNEFLWAGLIALGVAVLTVSYQAVRAAFKDPVQSLRYE